MSVNTFNLSIIHQKMCDEFIADIWIFAIQNAWICVRHSLQPEKMISYNTYKLIDENDEMSLYVHEELGLDC